ncbi:MAG: ABC transporter ATP-binding protein [Firmicutes bacterium]|nr:ABC transporter ATP-binding protein [Bacillota bacterium]
MKENAIEIRNLTKSFGSIKANNKVCLEVKEGEILALLGENGSGKTTLMNMLSGIYFPDSGEILVHGKEVTIRSPKDSYDLGIGMVHQHFKLVDVFTAAENIVLGIPGAQFMNMSEIKKKIKALIDKYGFEIDLDKKIYDMSVSEKQTVEIIKILFRGANILILDEPTAVLTPQETKRLFGVLRNMRENGKAIIIITHKLHEVLEISDRVSVLRKGEYAGTVNTCDADEMILTEMMVGKKVELNIERTEPENVSEKLRVENLTCINADGRKVLDNVTFTAYSGEILGIAGIAGSGQKELLEAIAGLQTAEDGSIIYTKKDEEPCELVGKTPLQIRDMGIALAFVPEDRLGMGLVGSMGMTGNMMLRNYKRGSGPFTERKYPRKLAESIKEKLDVVTPGLSTPVRKLSGGNVQKVLVGREIALKPQLLMAAYAVRGLDINTSYTIYNLLSEEKQKGVAVIYVGEDLDVLLELCDRIMVMCDGHVTGILDARTAKKEDIGLLMIKHDGKEE